MIDDHEDSRELLRLMVESFGATAVVAREGREGLAAASLRKPDAILCDLLMPHIDGFAFIERLRAYPRLHRVPVIAVSALGGHGDFLRTFEAGFNGHLVKPVTYETIAAMLRRVFWAHTW